MQKVITICFENGKLLEFPTGHNLWSLVNENKIIDRFNWGEEEVISMRSLVEDPIEKIKRSDDVYNTYRGYSESIFDVEIKHFVI